VQTAPFLGTMFSNEVFFIYSTPFILSFSEPTPKIQQDILYCGKLCRSSGILLVTLPDFKQKWIFWAQFNKNHQYRTLRNFVQMEQKYFMKTDRRKATNTDRQVW